MRKQAFLAIRNINLVFVLLLLAGFFLIDKQTCAYAGVEIAFGLNLLIQSTSIIWNPDLFVCFISVFQSESSNFPAWKDVQLSQKFRLGIVALFFASCSVVSIYSGWTKLLLYACV
jgi:hypothetical protein